MFKLASFTSFVSLSLRRRRHHIIRSNNCTCHSRAITLININNCRPLHITLFIRMEQNHWAAKSKLIRIRISRKSIHHSRRRTRFLENLCQFSKPTIFLIKPIMMQSILKTRLRHTGESWRSFNTSYNNILSFWNNNFTAITTMHHHWHTQAIQCGHMTKKTLFPWIHRHTINTNNAIDTILHHPRLATICKINLSQI